MNGNTTTSENEYRIEDNLDVSVVDRDDGVYRVVNLSHDDPEEHEYKVFCDDGDAYHCECPAFEYGNGLDENGLCKHMRVVEQFIPHIEWRDYQQVQKQREEEKREQAAVEAKVALFDGGADVGDDDEYTAAEKQVLESAEKLAEVSRELRAEDDEDDVDESVEEELPDFEDYELDDDEEKFEEEEDERVEEVDLMSKEEWRSLSNEGRRMTVAFL